MVEIVDNYNIAIGQNLRIARIEAGKSQQDIADLLGITFQQVQKYEKAQNRINPGALKYLADILGKPLAYFYGVPDCIYPEVTDGRDNKKALSIIRALAAIESNIVRKRLESLILTLANQEAIAN